MSNIQQIKQIEIDGVLYPVQDAQVVETIQKYTNTQELIITKRDGTSSRISNMMVGATESSNGQAGYIPTPTIEDYSDNRFLSAKGEWGSVNNKWKICQGYNKDNTKSFLIRQGGYEFIKVTISQLYQIVRAWIDFPIDKTICLERYIYI